MATSSRPPASASAPAIADVTPQADHDVLIAQLVAAEAKHPFQITAALAAAMPFASWIASIERASMKASPTVVAHAVLPCPTLTQAESAKFRTPVDLPRYTISVSEAQWCHACAIAQIYGVPLTPLPILALLMAEAAVRCELPDMARPFLPEWHRALVDLMGAVVNMSWQGLSVQFDRHAVHKLRQAIKEEARTTVRGTWTRKTTEGIAAW